jgi:Tol biopolymer transport system component
VLVDRNGKNEQPLTAPPRSYLYPRVSPDQTRVAVDVREGENDIWVWHLLRRTFTRVTQHRDQDRTPVWADNDHLFYSASIDGTPNIYRQRADGTGEPERAIQVRAAQPLFALSMAGNRLIVSNTSGGIGAASLFTLDVAPPRSPVSHPTNGTSSKAAALPTAELLVRGPAGVINGMVSPDGRWLVYQSNESGRWDVYVQPYGAGATGPRQAISPTGGIQPRWSADGRELFYVSPANEMMIMRVQPGALWSASAPERVFDATPYYFGTAGNPFWMYDVMDDGRFVMVKPPQGAAAAPQPADHIHIIQNWTEELKKRSER